MISFSVNRICYGSMQDPVSSGLGKGFGLENKRGKASQAAAFSECLSPELKTIIKILSTKFGSRVSDTDKMEAKSNKIVISDFCDPDQKKLLIDIQLAKELFPNGQNLRPLINALRKFPSTISALDETLDNFAATNIACTSKRGLNVREVLLKQYSLCCDLMVLAGDDFITSPRGGFIGRIIGAFPVDRIREHGSEIDSELKIQLEDSFNVAVVTYANNLRDYLYNSIILHVILSEALLDLYLSDKYPADKKLRYGSDELDSLYAGIKRELEVGWCLSEDSVDSPVENNISALKALSEKIVVNVRDNSLIENFISLHPESPDKSSFEFNVNKLLEAGQSIAASTDSIFEDIYNKLDEVKKDPPIVTGINKVREDLKNESAYSHLRDAMQFVVSKRGVLATIQFATCATIAFVVPAIFDWPLYFAIPAQFITSLIASGVFKKATERAARNLPSKWIKIVKDKLDTKDSEVLIKQLEYVNLTDFMSYKGNFSGIGRDRADRYENLGNGLGVTFHVISGLNLAYLTIQLSIARFDMTAAIVEGLAQYKFVIFPLAVFSAAVAKSMGRIVDMVRYEKLGNNLTKLLLKLFQEEFDSRNKVNQNQ